MTARGHLLRSGWGWNFFQVLLWILIFFLLVFVLGWIWAQWREARFEKMWEIKEAELAEAGLPLRVEDLLPALPPAEANAAPLLLEAAALWRENRPPASGDRSEAPPWRWKLSETTSLTADPAERSRLLASLEEPPFPHILTLLAQASERPFCRFDREVEWGWQMDLVPMSDLLHLGQLLASRTVLLAYDGRTGEAWQSFRELWRLSELAEQDPFLISWLVAASLEALALQSLHDALGAPDMMATLAGEADFWRGEIGRHHSSLRRSLARALDGERIFFVGPIFDHLRKDKSSLPALIQMFGAKPKEDNSFSWDALWFNLFGWAYQYPARGWMDQDQLASLEFHRRIRADLLAPQAWSKDSSPSQEIEEWVKELPATHLLTKLSAPAISGLKRRVRERETRLQIAALALSALATYQNTGRFPDDLSALLQSNKIPFSGVDPFTGEPLRYQVGEDSILLYSLGPDQEDQGGTHRRQGKNFDLPWHWPPPVEQ